MRLIDKIVQIKSKCRFEEEISEAFNLTNREIECLCCFNSPEGYSSREIAGLLGLSASRTSRLITKLVDTGYLEESIDKGDRRYLNINLSKKGLECYKEIQKMKDICEDELKQRIKPDDYRIIDNGLDVLINIL